MPTTPAPMKTQYIYTIARAYKSATVWCCDNKTRRRQGQLKLTPNPTLGRREKYEEIARWFRGMKIPVPVYGQEGVRP